MELQLAAYGISQWLHFSVDEVFNNRRSATTSSDVVGFNPSKTDFIGALRLAGRLTQIAVDLLCKR